MKDQATDSGRHPLDSGHLKFTRGLNDDVDSNVAGNDYGG
jgi:hypothetical protein